jgi:ribosome-associated protein
MTTSIKDKEAADIPISKTRKKKEDRARQMLGERLVGLSENQLERMGLSDEILEEVYLAGKTTAYGARQRQIKYIGSLLRKIDIIPIEKVLEVIDRGDYEQKAAFKKLENLRGQLREGNMELINEILEEFPLAERQQLTQLTRNAKKEFEGNKGSKASKVLFRYLKNITASL